MFLDVVSAILLTGKLPYLTSNISTTLSGSFLEPFIHFFMLLLPHLRLCLILFWFQPSSHLSAGLLICPLLPAKKKRSHGEQIIKEITIESCMVSIVTQVLCAESGRVSSSLWLAFYREESTILYPELHIVPHSPFPYCISSSSPTYYSSHSLSRGCALYLPKYPLYSEY